MRRELLDDRAAELAADLLAAVGDLEAPARIASDRFALRASGTDGPNSVGNIAIQPAGSVVSPFITARARTRWAGVASARSVGGARDERVGLDAGVDDRAPVARRVLEPHGVSPEREQRHLRERRQPVDGAMRVGDAADLVDRAVDGGVASPASTLAAPRGGGDGLESLAPGARRGR